MLYIYIIILIKFAFELYKYLWRVETESAKQFWVEKLCGIPKEH